MSGIFDKPQTLGDIFGQLGADEAIIAEYPNGYKKYFCKRSLLDKVDAVLPIDKDYKYDWASETYHVKIAKYKPGLCESQKEDYHDNKIEIKPRNRCYIDPISRTKNIREWYGLLYDKYFKIKRIICDGPATIIFWDDGTKTVVKAQDEFDYEKGILYAALKKLATKKEYDNILRAIDKVDEARKDDPVKLVRDNLFPDRALSPSEAEEFTKKKREPKYQKCPVCGRGYNLNYYRMNKLSKQGFVDIRCPGCDTLFRVKGNMNESKWHTKLEHEVLAEDNPEPTNQCGTDHVEAEKPKKKVYKRHFGDSNQRCPYCGQNWIWSGKRRISFYHDGFIKFTCKNCGRKIIYTKEGKYA